MTPYFSIIIPTLNEEKYLPILLQNIATQTLKNFEVIIIDANSEDKTKVVAEQFKEQVPLTFYTVSKRQVTYQRNYGAKKAKGEYLVFLDADEIVENTFIHLIHQEILKNRREVYLPYVVPDDPKTYPEVGVLFYVLSFLIEFSQNTSKPFSSGGAMVIESKFFHRIAGFDEKVTLAEDHAIVQKAAKYGAKARFMRSARVKISLRRMKTEGRLQLLYKYIISTLYLFFKGDIKKKLYSYEMGGGQYKKQ